MKNDIVIYISEDGLVKLNVNLNNGTVWLNLDQISELFEQDKSVISRHIKNIFAESELCEKSVVVKFATTASDGKTYDVSYYDLDVIISVGYRVKSKRGTQFRIWANQILKESLIKGFAINDARLKNNGNNPYFEELLARIRDIRSSEKVFWRKVIDIFATSIDCNPQEQICIEIFQTIQKQNALGSTWAYCS